MTRGRRDDYRNDYCLGDSWLYRICCRVAMNAGEKFLLDIALVGLIIVLVDAHGVLLKHFRVAALIDDRGQILSREKRTLRILA